jgi:hypothetical protein
LIVQEQPRRGPKAVAHHAARARKPVSPILTWLEDGLHGFLGGTVSAPATKSTSR